MDASSSSTMIDLSYVFPEGKEIRRYTQSLSGLNKCACSLCVWCLCFTPVFVHIVRCQSIKLMSACDQAIACLLYFSLHIMLADLVLTAEGRTSASLWMEIAIINACIHSCM